MGSTSSFKMISTLICLKDLVKVPLGPLTVMVLDLTETWTKEILKRTITVARNVDSIAFRDVFH